MVNSERVRVTTLHAVACYFGLPNSARFLLQRDAAVDAQCARELACGRAASGLFRISIWIKHCADAFEAAVQRNCDTKLLSFHNSTSIEVQNKVIRNRIL
jgi:hypothetical protein